MVDYHLFASSANCVFKRLTLAGPLNTPRSFSAVKNKKKGNCYLQMITALKKMWNSMKQVLLNAYYTLIIGFTQTWTIKVLTVLKFYNNRKINLCKLFFWSLSSGN